MEIKDKNKSDKLSYCTIYTEFYLLLLMLPAMHMHTCAQRACVLALCYATAAAAEDDTCESIIFHLVLLVFVFKALFSPPLGVVANRRCYYFVRVFYFHCYFRFPFRLAKNLAFNY